LDVVRVRDQVEQQRPELEPEDVAVAAMAVEQEPQRVAPQPRRRPVGQGKKLAQPRRPRPRDRARHGPPRPQATWAAGRDTPPAPEGMSRGYSEPTTFVKYRGAGAPGSVRAGRRSWAIRLCAGARAGLGVRPFEGPLDAAGLQGQVDDARAAE